MVNGSESFGEVKGFGRATRDTRNNWLQFMFVTHKRYNCFRKQSTINSCTSGFKELEAFGFEFGEIGFGGTHVHFDANVPKKYSVMVAEIMLKSHSAKRIFAEHPGFRKRYPDGRFWSGYEHHYGIGQDFEQAEAYARSQAEHHGVKVIDDAQQRLPSFTAEADTSRPSETRA